MSGVGKSGATAPVYFVGAQTPSSQSVGRQEEDLEAASPIGFRVVSNGSDQELGSPRPGLASPLAIIKPTPIELYAPLSRPNTFEAFCRIGGNSRWIAASQFLSQFGVAVQGFLVSNHSGAASAEAVAANKNFITYPFTTVAANMHKPMMYFLRKTGDDKAAKGRLWRSGLVFSGLIGVCLSAAYLGMPYTLPAIAHVSKDAAAIAAKYDQILVGTAFLTTLKGANRIMYYSVGQDRKLFYFALSSSLVLVPASILLSRPLPIQGVALGKVIGNFVAQALAFGYMFFSDRFKQFELCHLNMNDCRMFCKIVTKGLLNGLSYLFEVGSNVVMAGMMSHLGPNNLIAYHIVSVMMQYLTTGSFCIGFGLYKSLSDKDHGVSSRYYNSSSFWGATLWGLLIWGMGFLLLPAVRSVASLYMSDVSPSQYNDILDLAEVLMLWSVVGSLMDNMRNIYEGAQQAMSQVFFSTCTTGLCRGGIATALSLYLGFYSKSSFLPTGARGVLAGHIIGTSLGGLAQLIQFRRNIARIERREQERLNPQHGAGTEATALLATPFNALARASSNEFSGVDLPYNRPGSVSSIMDGEC